jgi:hypothetical protein
MMTSVAPIISSTLPGVDGPSPASRGIFYIKFSGFLFGHRVRTELKAVNSNPAESRFNLLDATSVTVDVDVELQTSNFGPWCLSLKLRSHVVSIRGKLEDRLAAAVIVFPPSPC